jgi:CRISPR system Cascade subunit CasD
VTEHLILCLEGPLQAWGDVAMDPRRPTRAFPSRSALAGLLANALGWRYRDADRTTALQDALRYAVREDRRPQIVRDYQTADLGAIGTEGWTRWGVEKRGGGSAAGTQILEKLYLADGAFRVALALRDDAPVALDDIEAALRRPARPIFLGRKGCPPAGHVLEGRREAPTPADALLGIPLATHDRDLLTRAGTSVRVWYDPADGGPEGFESVGAEDVWDRRDFRSNRFGGSRRVAQLLVPVDRLPSGPTTREAA